MSTGFSMSLGSAPAAAAPPPAAPLAAFGLSDVPEDAPPPPPRDLVIPLTTNPWKAEDPGTPPRDTDDLDEAAAAAVIAEGINMKVERADLVIVGPAQEAKAQPLLKAAMLPGLNEVEDDGERFKRDLEMRADDINVTGDAYRAVRIEEFGRGLLRGMGWSGFSEEDEKRFSDPVARPRGLGLGATPKPSEIYDRRGRLREGYTATNKDADKAIKEGKWLGAQTAKKESTVQLQTGNIVRIERPRGDRTLEEDLCGRRARIEAPSDDAKPNHARVVLERSGEVLCVPIRALRLDTSSKPFREAQRKRKLEGADITKKRARRDAAPLEPWLVAGVRVRVGRDGDALFRKKGRVLDVLLSTSGARRATLALDGGGRVDEPGYRERHLETALPWDGGPVRAVLGARAGAHGVLLGRDRKKETATVRFDDDDAIEALPMDFVAEWCGGGTGM